MLRDSHMNAAHLIPSLDTCEALKGAGFPQNTVFVWSSHARPSIAPRGAVGGGSAEKQAAPTLAELLAHLPAELAFALPHPIFGSTERVHALEVSVGPRTVLGYHIAGSREVQHRTEHENAVEAAAQLYLALHEAGRLPPAKLAGVALPDEAEGELLAQAA